MRVPLPLRISPRSWSVTPAVTSSAIFCERGQLVTGCG